MARPRPGSTSKADVGKPRSVTRSSPHWTQPAKASPYPQALTSDQDDPNQGSSRFLPAIMVMLALVSYLFVVPLINTGVTYIGYLVEAPGLGWTAYSETAASYKTVWGLLGGHAGLISLIAVVWLYWRFVHRRRLTWLWSVSPGVRWRYALICFMVAAIIIGAVSIYHWFTGPGSNPGDDWAVFLAVIVITTPFQALAEEMLFRGHLLQLVGTVARNNWVAIAGTAIVFAMFHGSQDPWLFASRLAFGLMAGFLVWKTGGLEAAVVIHVINNLCAYGLAIATGTVSELRQTTSVDWLQAVTDVSMFAICAAICWWIAVKLRVPTKVRS